MGLYFNSMGNLIFWFVFILELVSRQTLKCDGPSKAMKSCNENYCPSWTPSPINFIYWFGFFLDLTTRQTLKCDGPSKDMRSCSENDCPSWTPWSEWSQCSFTCGGGTCTSERICRLPDGTKVPNGQCTDGKHTLVFHQIEPLKNGASLILPSSIAKNS